MKVLSISMLSLGLLAAPVLAQEATTETTTPVTVVVDANNDGFYSADELRVVWVDLSDEDIVLIDADSDGNITEVELTQAQTTLDIFNDTNGNAGDGGEESNDGATGGDNDGTTGGDKDENKDG